MMTYDWIRDWHRATQTTSDEMSTYKMAVCQHQYIPIYRSSASEYQCMYCGKVIDAWEYYLWQRRP